MLSHVWYVGYGSNLLTERFRHYIEGGAPAGARRAASGCRDTTPPQADRGVRVPGGVRFAWESPTWGGGIAFYDAAVDRHIPVRAHLITTEQFLDVAAQEMHREPGDTAHPVIDLAEALDGGAHTYGPGRYETLHHLGELDGLPMLTFTAADPTALPLNAPRAAYLTVIVRGLREGHEFGDDEIVEHLLACPGVTPDWSAEALQDLLDSTTQA